MPVCMLVSLPMCLSVRLSAYYQWPARFRHNMVPSICVVGGGVIGMTTAVNIVSSIPSVHVTVMAERFSPDTTSDVAAGFCFPHKLSDTPKHLVRYSMK